MFAAPILGSIGLGATAAGSIFGAASSVLGGFSKAGMYNYQAGVALANAQMEKQNASYSLNTGELRTMESGMKTAAQVGQTTVRQAAGNIEVGTGSSADVVASERALGRLDQSIIQRDAARSAYGHFVQASLDTAQAGAYKSAASSAIVGGILGGLGSLASGAGSVASKWFEGGSTGLFGADTADARYLAPHAIDDSVPLGAG